MIDHMLFNMKKWFSPNGMVINADGLNYYALPKRIRVAKGTKVTVLNGEVSNGEAHDNAFLQADVIGEVFGMAKNIDSDKISSFLFTPDKEYSGLFKDADGETVFYGFKGIFVSSDECQIISEK